jgi:hypothetical protein
MRPLEHLQKHATAYSKRTGRVHMAHDWPGFVPDDYADNPALFAEAKLIFAQWQQAKALHHMIMAPRSSDLVWHQSMQRDAGREIALAMAAL